VTLDELLRKVATEPPRVEEREVSVASPELLAELEVRGSMLLTDFVSDPRRTTRRRTFRHGHVLGPPLTTSALATWHARWPRHPLPTDLSALLLRVNGIHLWADLDTGRSYEGLAPLEEWGLARVAMWGPNAGDDLLGDRHLAISYHTDHAAFVTLDVDSGRYHLMDACGADESSLIGRNVEDVLEYLWTHRIPPRSPAG
jgi:hypothetical protein